jgi:hypothetical protein
MFNKILNMRMANEHYKFLISGIKLFIKTYFKIQNSLKSRVSHSCTLANMINTKI